MFLTLTNSISLALTRCLWFMLEVLMTKNENNSHSFLRKMVENIKQTKDAQAPDDPKANEVSKLQHFCCIRIISKCSLLLNLYY